MNELVVQQDEDHVHALLMICCSVRVVIHVRPEEQVARPPVTLPQQPWSLSSARKQLSFKRQSMHLTGNSKLLTTSK
jgi:hypothetical protein